MEFQNEKWISNSLMQSAGLETQSLPEQTLFIVGVPIGNLGDITLRALWTLTKCNRIAAEDTRETRKLLDKFGISVPLISVREHNEREGAEQLLHYLSQGERIALVTDAGTPCVSDPGAKVVHIVREAGYNVVPIPGPSAVVTALSAAGLTGMGFSFVGFVPPQPKARRKALEYWLARSEPFVLYEAPHRILALLEDIAALATPTRHIVIAREITKKFETFTSLSMSELPEWIKTHTPRGEYVILIDEETEKTEGLSERDQAWMNAFKGVLPHSKMASLVSKVTGVPRDEIYKQLCESNQ